MSVQAAVSFLNGNATNTVGKGRGSSKIINRPSLPKATDWTTNVKTTTTTTSWNTKIPTLPNNKKDKVLTKFERAKSPALTDLVSVKATHAINSKPTTNSSIQKQETRSILDKHAEELIALYQEALDNYSSANDTITKLEADLEIYACDSTKVRDYEIRLQYLAQKLEQVSEERDILEQELTTYKVQYLDFKGTQSEEHLLPVPNETITANDDPNSGTVGIIQEQQVDDAYYDEILNAYEEQRSQENENENNSDIQQKQHHEHMVLMEQMLAEYDQGMKMAMESYVADLEKQRLENRTLQSMVKKQDELIKKLEVQCNNPSPPINQQHTLHQPSNPQQDATIQQPKKYSNRTKKTNNGAKQQLKEQRNKRFSSSRSSIDVLEEIAKTGNIPTSLSGSIRPIPSPQPYHYHHHHQRDTGRSTPPPFAPPRTPLPPLPASYSSISLNNDPSIMTSTRGSLISYSRSSTSSTSWSSDEQNQQHHPISALPLPKHNSADNNNISYSPLVQSLDSTTSPATSGSFWKGLKKKF